MLKYKNIVFDFGNVIAEFDETYLIEKFCPDADYRSRFASAVYHDWWELDAGISDYEDSLQQAVKMVPECIRENVIDFYENWYRHLLPIEETWKLIRELKSQGASLYILSNASVQFARHADFYEITKEFDGILFSAPVKMAKPDPAFYHHLFHTFHLNPNECFFIDDREDNIETGKSLGMNGIQFTGDIAAVKSALEKTD